MMKADKEINDRYKFLRNRHGQTNPQANGYRMENFFKREQRILLSALDKNNDPILDVACGSGLMLAPLLQNGHDIYGIDFNADATAAAHTNGIKILRGDAFNMPIPDNTIGQIVNCQFLNQQPPEQTKRFIEESARILKPGGRLIILWRHANSLLHKSAHTAFTLIDRFTGQPPFPQYEHPISEIKTYATQAGLKTAKEAVTLPLSIRDMVGAKDIRAKIIGASLFIVLKKP